MLGDKSEELELGGTVGFYRLERQVARGGMGAVYEATDTRTDKKVALKFMRTGVVRSEVERKRFEREMIVATMLDHPGIVKVIEFGEHKGEPYYVMKYIEGWSLSSVPKDILFGFAGPPPPHDAVDNETEHRRLPSTREKTKPSMGRDYFSFVAKVGVQAAEALEYAHQQGVIHRDIKPSNMMLTPEGRVKILDFGLAKAVGLEKLTTTGDFFGTPAYMSPEQAAGEVSRIDHRTDVYSLGTTLYQLLTFSTPFAGETRVVTSAIIHRQPVEPRKLNRLIPGSMNAIVLKAMEKRKEDRYLTAREFSEDLRSYLTGRKVKARQGSFGWKISNALRKRRREVVLVSSSLLAVALLVAGVRGCINRRRNRYDVLIASGNNLVDHGLFAKAIGCFKKALRLEKDSAEARLKIWDAECRLKKLLPGSSNGGASAVAFSPSGKFLAAGYEDRSVRIWDVNALQDHPRLLQGHGSRVTALCFSADERLLASGDVGGYVKVWNLSEGTEEPSLRASDSRIRSLAFMNSGRRLFVSDAGGHITICDPWADSGHQLSDWPGSKDLEGSRIGVNRRGGFFSVIRIPQSSTAERWAEVFDIASNSCSIRVPLPTGTLHACAVSEAGNMLALGYEEGRIALFTQDEDSPHYLTTENASLTIVELAFFDGGRKLLSVSSSGTMIVWDVTRRTAEVTLANTCDEVNAVDVTSGRRLVALATAVAGIQVWKTDSDQALHSAKVISLSSDMPGSPPPRPDVVAFSAKGKFLAVGDNIGAITIWKTATGELVQSYGMGHYGIDVVRETGDQSKAPIRRSIEAVELEKLDPASSEVTPSGYAGDWYRFTVTSSGTYAIETRQVAGKAAMDTMLWLYEDTKERIARDDDGGEGHFSKIVRDLDPGNYIVRVTKSPSPVRAFAFSPRHEELLAFSIRDKERSIRILDVKTGRVRRSSPQDHVTWSLAFREDGRLLASGDDNSCLTLWDPVSLTKKRSEPLVHSRQMIVRPLRFAVRNSDTLVAWTPTDGHAWRWRTRKPERPKRYPGPGITPTCTAIGPRGHLVAIVSQKGHDVGIWDLRRNSPVWFKALEERQTGINRLVFSHDGQIVASAGEDTILKLWDVKHERDILILTTEPERALSLALDRSTSRTTSRMAVGLTNGKVILYDFSSP